MKRGIVLAFCVLLVCGAAVAADHDHEERFCPAHRAAQHGHDAFEEFHHAMAPAWHNAWPAKDYDALMAAAPEFAAQFEHIAAMEPEFKSPTKAKRFESKRAEFGEIVKQYAAAAEAGDKETVYELMPGLHDAFEHTAACLLPTSYRELKGLMTVSDKIVNKHLPEKNHEGIVGSTETLVIQVEALNEETIPDDLQYFKPQLLEQFTELKKLVGKARECCDKEDMAGYEEHVTKLHAVVSEMIATYL
ncbi:hypothetical protein GF377_09385 [candidate division GN15 bacterium]|nr:hypothetical protein [candidate division GN15 bacterium]